jgi:DNA-binding XRE family transcriptional regulator
MPNGYHIGNSVASHKLPRRATLKIGETAKMMQMVTRIEPKDGVEQFIQEWRELRGYSQEELANMIGTTKASISRWETDERDPTMKVLGALADALEIEIADLFRHPTSPSCDSLLRKLPKDKQLGAIEFVKTYLKVS